MKLKTILLLAVAVGCGLVAMLGVQRSMTGGGQVEAEEKVSVLMAVTNIDVGEVLTPDNCAFRNIAVTTAPQNSVLTEAEYKNRSAVVKILANDFITLPKLSEPGVSGKSVAIPMGMRVVTVPVNDTTSHSGMLSAGDRVDVLVTYQSRTQRGQTTQTKVLLEFVEVFATGNRTASEASGNNDEKIKNVSLLVTPDQTPYVKLAEKKGTLSLSWRRKDDDEYVKVGAVDEELMQELQGTLDKDHRGFEYPTYEVYADAAEPNQEKPGLKSWLDQQEKRAAAEPQPTPKTGTAVEETKVASADPSRPKWKMEIFYGEKCQLVELDLPEEGASESPPTERKTQSPTGDDMQKTPESSGSEPVKAESKAAAPLWKSLLQGLQQGTGT